MPTPNARTSSPWSLTLLGLLVIASLVSLPFLVGAPDSRSMPDIVRFLGRLHPVLLHLPIGVFTLIVLQELGAIVFRNSPRLRETGIFPLFFGVASAVLAVIAGFLLYQGDGYEDNDLASRHLWGGIAFAVAAILTFLVKAWAVARGGNPLFYRVLLFGSVGLMAFASHDGASITHGSDYLTRYAPDPLRKLLHLPVKPSAAPTRSIEEQVVYTDIIMPIFEQRCIQCHKEGNSKGKLRMDEYEALLAGGREGAAIEPGSASESYLIHRIELPLDDDDHMPPEGKPQMTEAELVLVKWWLDSGADPAATVGSLERPTAVQQALAQWAPVSTAPQPTAVSRETTSQSAPSPPAEGTAPDPALQASVSQLAGEFPGALTFESRKSSLLSFTGVSMRAKLDDAAFAKLEPVLPHLVTLDLSATQISDASVDRLTAAKHLKLLRLNETAISDRALETLSQVSSLESLNLHSTRISDAGLAKLASLSRLKRLYLWQTDVSPDAIAKLQAQLPSCEIITGA